MSGNISSERAARNQSVYRSANEKLKPINAAVHQRGDPLGEWICECADASCELHVLATRLEYEQIRANPRAFIVYRKRLEDAMRAIADQENPTPPGHFQRCSYVKAGLVLSVLKTRARRGLSEERCNYFGHG